MLRLGIGVEFVNGEMVAESLPVWLLLEPEAPIESDSWIRLRYYSNILDDNVRPLIRFTDDKGETSIQPMNGTLFGVGEWIGYIPKDVTAISISPVARTGRFDFRIERLDYISPMQLMLRGLSAEPLAVVWSLQAWWRNARAASRRGLKVAGSSTALARYGDWHQALSRAADIAGIDRPRADWNKTPGFRIVMTVDPGKLAALQSTVQSLLAQIYRRWSLYCVIDERCTGEQRQAILAVLGIDARMSATKGATELSAIAKRFSDDDICVVMRTGDTLPHYALAVVAEMSARYPAIRTFYGDEDSIASSGRLHTPVLRPDWSPYCQTASHYVEHPFWLRAHDVQRHGGISAAQFISAHDDIVASILADCEKDNVHHIRRVLYRRSREPSENTDSQRSIRAAQSRHTANSLTQYPEVTAIVLSRDNAECLSACMDGLLKNTDYIGLRVTLVDNGSVKPDALALLRDLKRHPKVDVIERPGPFNYSALCNDAVQTSQAPMLVFLNDDIAMRDAGWLKPLIYWATRPDVGLAGAKLLFPNGRIQHAGVVLGMGGIAAHLYHNQAADQAGYLGRLKVAHEISAVTAACVAIERRKFDLVGGFDAVHLPVELNDIDLCLRLAEQGLSTMWTPESVLIHRESASRGKTWSGDEYHAERAYFIARWQDAIRDDRYFHPDLSLFSYKPALA